MTDRLRLLPPLTEDELDKQAGAELSRLREQIAAAAASAEMAPYFTIAVGRFELVVRRRKDTSHEQGH